MVIRLRHLVMVCAVALAAVTALLTFVALGHRTANATKTIALMPVTIPAEAAEAAATANVREAVPSIEAFYSDHGTYAGATIAELRAYDPGLDPSLRLGWVQSGSYCIESTLDGRTASVTGPGGDVVSVGC
jgi:hypothetical protein